MYKALYLIIIFYPNNWYFVWYTGGLFVVNDAPDASNET